METNTSFKGIYTNYASEEQHYCAVRLYPDYIAISYIDDASGQEANLRWELNKITKPRTAYSANVRLMYDEPKSEIEIFDATFADIFAQAYRRYSFAPAKGKSQKTLMSRGTKTAASVIFGIIAFVIFSYFVLVPIIAEYTAGFVPVKAEKAIGEAVYRDMVSGSSKNEERSKLVESFFEELNLDTKYEYKITVLNSYEVNAFALPAGRIVIYNEIINKMNSYTELAALLAHESSHVELQHSLKSILRSVSGSVVLSVVFGDMSSITGIILQNTELLTTLQYSRKMEKQADLRGLKQLMKKGIDPNGMLDLFNTLKDEGDGGDEYISEFISTHPLFDSRITYITEYIDKHKRRAKYKEHPRLESLWDEIKETE